MGGISKATRKKRFYLARANEKRRQQSLLRKAGLLTSAAPGQTEGPSENNCTRCGQPVKITIKQENDNLDLEKVAEEEREDLDGTPPRSPVSPASSSPSSLDNPPTTYLTSSPVISVVTNCLLCNRLQKSTDFTSSLTTSLTEANFQVYFILRKVLNVPKAKLVDYLVNFGDPRQWIQTCRDCVSIVDKAVRLQQDITKLEEKLRECQAEMKERIRKSIEVNKPKSLISGNINQVTMETRDLVCRKGKENEVETNVPTISTGSGDQKTISVAILSSAGGEGTNEQAVKLVSCQFEEYPEDQDKQRTETGIQFISHNYSSDDADKEESETESESSSLYEAPTSQPSDQEDNQDESDNSLKNYQIIITSEAPSVNTNQSASWKLLRKDYECFKEGAYRCPMCDGDDNHPNAGVAGTMPLEKFISHLIFHKKRPLKCTECGLHFANLDELKKKNRLAADPSPTSIRPRNHACSPSTVTLEMGEFNPGKIWQCHGCLSTFNSEDTRENHQETCPDFKTCETVRKFECQICEDEENPNKKSYPNLTEWALHRCLSHPDKAAQSCLYCNQIFTIKTKEGIDLPNYYALRVHMQGNHSPAPVRRCPDVCDFCGGVFSNVLEFYDHLKDTHNLAKGTAYSCEICYLRNSQRCQVRRHIELMHDVRGRRVPPGDEGEGGKLICDICGYSCTGKYVRTFLDHKLTQHGIIPEGKDVKGYRGRIRECDKEGCGFKSLFVRKVRVHGMKEHGAERELKCQFCGKGFLYGGKLREHEEIHKNKSVKPYQCEICGNRFAVKNYLYIHMRLSHQNRPFASTNKKRKRKAV